MTAVAVLSLLIWLYLLAGHGRFWQSAPELPMRRPTGTPTVAIVVPARDEAAVIERTLRSLLAQDYAGAFRVILVDDGSTDGTGDIARALCDTRGSALRDAPGDAASGPPGDMVGDQPGGDPVGSDQPGGDLPGDARLTVVQGAPRPEGWSGKLWAVHQGVAAAGAAEFLLLTDADIVHDPSHLAALVAQAEVDDLDMVSEMVRLACDSWAERALVPAFVFFFQLLYPFGWVNNRMNRTAAAAGGTVLIRRRALQRIGGIEAVRGALIDDVALAVAVKKGGPIWLGHATGARSVRPYPAVADIWRMITRTAYVQLRYSPLLLVATVLGMVVTWVAPPLAAITGGGILGQGLARFCGLIAWIMLSAAYLPTLRRYGQSRLWAPLLPLVAGFYTAATVAAAVNHYTGRGVAWKNRTYQQSGA
jgi:hopene-associated glycosyltransferase HpnB